jgi:hypothetical protein
MVFTTPGRTTVALGMIVVCQSEIHRQLAESCAFFASRLDEVVELFACTLATPRPRPHRSHGRAFWLPQ